MLTKLTRTDESICGYRLKERLGSGGYGEVWSAEAPGGIQKAVKIIYGYHDEDRAERELKALNRIKQLRHPFLLSLERIEVADGKLVVVTELADMGLKDRFDQYLADGKTGIPREELLRYLSDAAEALDFIREAHSLQHLDVKPENLLLVSGHIKVADFGLVKQIEDATASMMGGLTPMYAAPELFDGRPCQYSDQYSLAIVYQEMLTAVRPFSGTTTAQLAAQHMQSRPKLSPLPRADQAVIGRALAKDPEQRFPSCREMVEGLSKSHAPAQASDAGPRRSQPNTDTDVVTPSARNPEATAPVASSPKKGTEALTSVRGLGSLPKAATEVRELPPLECHQDQASLHPTLFVGIGHLASQALAKLRGRLCDRFGNMDQVPGIRILCLDTDRRSLFEPSRGEKGASLSDKEILEMPLRTPEEYRFGSSKHLSWLSRRWLYNIPRSGQTEGIRPLGRLALADHMPQLLARLAESIQVITQPDSVAKAAKAAGMPPSEGEARVFILASISGGTGSGMVLDVAYAVRKTLIDLELPDDYVYGVLLHSAQRVGSQRDLAIANTCACLSEMFHFSGASGYPGDESCGLPRFQDNRPTFSDTYLLHLGEDLETEALEASTDAIAEYLYMNSLTKCGATLETCRELTARTSDQSPDDFALRTFGLSQIGFSSGDVTARVIGSLCQKLIQRWLGEGLDGDGQKPKRPETPHGTADLDSCVREQTDRLGLSVDRLVEQVLAIVRQTCGGDVETHLAGVIAQALPADNDAPTDSPASAAIARLEEFFGAPELDGEPDAAAARFQVTCKKRLKVIGQRTTNELAGAVLALVDQPNARVHAAKLMLERFQALVDQLTKDATKHLEQTRSKRQQLETELLEPPAPKRRGMGGLLRRSRNGLSAGSPEQQLLRYARIRIEEFVLEYVLRLIGDIDTQLENVGDQLAKMRRTLLKLSEQFHDPRAAEQECYALVDEDDLDEQNRYLTSVVADALLAQASRMASQLDDQFQNGFFAETGGLHEILAQSSKELRELPELLQTEARSAVLTALDQTDLVQIILESGFNAEQLESILRSRLERARPKILQCGGAKRLLLALPEMSSSQRFTDIIANELNETPTVVQRPEGSLVLCYEAEQIPLRNVVFAMLENRPERAKYATRLHTRVDVDWPALPGSD